MDRKARKEAATALRIAADLIERGEFVPPPIEWLYSETEAIDLEAEKSLESYFGNWPPERGTGVFVPVWFEQKNGRCEKHGGPQIEVQPAGYEPEDCDDCHDLWMLKHHATEY